MTRVLFETPTWRADAGGFFTASSAVYVVDGLGLARCGARVLGVDVEDGSVRFDRPLAERASGGALGVGDVLVCDLMRRPEKLSFLEGLLQTLPPLGKAPMGPPSRLRRGLARCARWPRDPSDGALGALRLALALRASWPPAAAGSNTGGGACGDLAARAACRRLGSVVVEAGRAAPAQLFATS